MFAYFKTNGRAHDVRFVDEDYQPQEGELVGECTELPTPASLSDPDATAHLPDPVGFAEGIKTALGGIVAANALMRAYPAFYGALTERNWADVEALITDAKATGALTAQQYAGFQQLAHRFNIPVALP